MKCVKFIEFCETAFGETEENGIREVIVPFDKVVIDTHNGMAFLSYDLDDILRSWDSFEGECQSSVVMSTEVIEF